MIYYITHSLTFRMIIFSILLGLIAMALPVFTILSKKRDVSMFVLLSMFLCAVSLVAQFRLMNEYAVRDYIDSFLDTIHATYLTAASLSIVTAVLNLIAILASNGREDT